MKTLFSIISMICLSVVTLQIQAQKAVLKGTVTAHQSKEALIGVNVVANKNNGTTTNLDGEFKLRLDPGEYSISFSFIGYSEKTRQVDLEAGKTKTLNTSLKEKAQEMSTVVVTGSKYEKDLAEETVSMEVLKPDFIENSNATSMDEALEKVSGVSMMGEQISIRGGSGYQAGSGSRVLMLLDGLPLLRPDNGIIMWKSLPLENIQQVEVIKGASSALYGSSAMNGIINVRTANPSNEPYRKIVLYGGLYGNPPVENAKWWDRRPIFGGTRLAYRQRFNHFDVVLGGSYQYDKGYLQNSKTNFGRFNFKTRYRPPTVEGLTIGLNGNFSLDQGEYFFVWQDTGRKMYLPRTGGRYMNMPLSIDPHITYFDNKNYKHSFKGRFYRTHTINSSDDTSTSRLYYGSYNFHRKLKQLDINLTTGVEGYYSTINADQFGTHNGRNAAGFFQLDKTFFDRLNLTFGTRFEYFSIDSTGTNHSLPLLSDALGADIELPVKPVARFGANYEIAKATNIRASYGQAYRFPSIGEKYVETQRSGLRVAPNPDLKPETAWSAEIGINQGLKLSGWKGHVDFAGFVTEYSNMIEFQLKGDAGLYFQSVNIRDARISGVEISTMGQGSLFGFPTNIMFGYTYLYPIDLNDTSSTDNKSHILKYRTQHSAKADIETTINIVTLGAIVKYKSFMHNIDETLNLIKGVDDFRKMHDDGSIVIDIRIGLDVIQDAKISFITKNLFNELYTLRPAYIEAPRNYTVQLAYEF
ncbi:MAG: hypothetical protein BRD50_05110 [Bacteroidetes bacterium SW_11_45_7]|nr:MAG: hypothetical protein BRD50_05110 [Bacteroidetes bacterium SW_11_45_7]